MDPRLKKKRMALLARDRWSAARVGFEQRELDLLKLQRKFKDYRHNVYFLNRVGHLPLTLTQAALKIQHWFISTLVKCPATSSSRRSFLSAVSTPSHANSVNNHFRSPTLSPLTLSFPAESSSCPTDHSTESSLLHEHPSSNPIQTDDDELRDAYSSKGVIEDCLSSFLKQTSGKKRPPLRQCSLYE